MCWMCIGRLGERQKYKKKASKRESLLAFFERIEALILCLYGSLSKHLRGYIFTPILTL